MKCGIVVIAAVVGASGAALLAQATSAPALRPGTDAASPVAGSTSIATVPATTKPSPDALHAQAYGFMLRNQYDRARPLLQRAYDATPAPQRGRALVLNHAILDLTQKLHVMRALRDLEAYLTKHRGEDEPATDILGAALDLAAENPRWKETPVWQGAYREWSRRTYALEQSREGHRWGTRWLTTDEYLHLKAQREFAEARVRRQQEKVTHAREYVDFLRQYQAAYPNQSNNPRLTGERTTGDLQARRMGRHVDDYLAVLRDEEARLAEAQRQVPRPEWPRRFDPIDPAAPPPPESTAASTQPLPATLPNFGPAAD